MSKQAHPTEWMEIEMNKTSTSTPRSWFGMRGHQTLYRISRLRFAAGAILLLAALPTSINLAAEEFSPEQLEHFEKKVRPVLVNSCYECHGPHKQESGLRLDSRAALLHGGDSKRPVVVVGKPDESLLISAVKHENGLEMPPDKKLADGEVDDLRNWIAAGAAWPTSESEPKLETMDDRLAKHRSQHWAFQVPQPPMIPASPFTAKNSPIDSFVQIKQQEIGLQPSPEAEKRQLARRAYFDLTGLPPTFEELEEFVQDHSPNAYERLLDRLLASSRVGEKWGRHWLDLARYGDTSGYAFNRDRRYPFSFTYRDYVIRAINDDLSYDVFIQQQLAADQLPTAEDKKTLAALGFLTVGRKFNNPHDDIDDKIDVTIRGLMGITIACARCHDHKYDAIPMADYYSLYGVFASCNEPQDLPMIASADDIANNKPFFDQLHNLEADIENYIKKRHEEAIAHTKTKVYDYLVAAVYNLPDAANNPHPAISLGVNDIKIGIRDRWKGKINEENGPANNLLGIIRKSMAWDDATFTAQMPNLIKESLALSDAECHPELKKILGEKGVANKEELLKAVGGILQATFDKWNAAGANDAASQTLSESERVVLSVIIGANSISDFAVANQGQFINRADREHLAQLNSKITAHYAAAPPELGRAMIVADRPQPAEPHIFLRGNPARPGDRVPRQFVSIVTGPTRQPFARGSGRLDLAQAIVSKENPLTSRVQMNRTWMHLMGEPIVMTPSDFGIRTEAPALQPLLDHLASEFISRGWSNKSMLRYIMSSHTYRQQSLVSEEQSKLDPENRSFSHANRKRLEFEPHRDSVLYVAGELDLTIGGKSVDLQEEKGNKRRTLYAYIDRQDLPNLLRSFDFASPDSSTARRPKTTVPQQALFFMNSDFALRQSQYVVESEEILTIQDNREKIRAIYRKVLARDPQPNELELIVQYVEADPKRSPIDTWRLVAQTLLETNEFAFVD